MLVYGYLNIGALEDGRSYYQKFKPLRIAYYDGWAGEYWVDVTDKAWQEHMMFTGLAQGLTHHRHGGLSCTSTELHTELKTQRGITTCKSITLKT